MARQSAQAGEAAQHRPDGTTTHKRSVSAADMKVNCALKTAAEEESPAVILTLYCLYAVPYE